MMKLFDEIPYLEDEQIILHRIEEKDADVLEAMWQNPEVTRTIPTFLYEGQFADKSEAIRQMYEGVFERKESLLLGIYLKSTPDQLAGIGEYYNYDPHWNKASIGIRLNRPYWHQGIGEHAIALLRDYLFTHTDVKRITVHIMAENIYSQRAAVMQGFRLRMVHAAEDWGFDKPVIVNKYVLEKLGNISYAKIGDGQKTMVILPGLAFKSTLGSADLVEAHYYDIFKDYTIYLFDDRSNIDENYSIRERAGDVAAEMKTLHLRDAYVFGASMGGMVGQYLAIDHPDLVKKLALTATACHIDGRPKQVVEKWKALVEAGQIREAIHESVQEIYSASTIEQFGKIIEANIGVVSEEEQKDFVALCDAILGFDCRGDMDQIQCPVMVIGSYGDRVLFPESPKEIADRLGCELYMYDDAYGHAVYDEARDHRERILNFFESEC